MLYNIYYYLKIVFLFFPFLLIIKVFQQLSKKPPQKNLRKKQPLFRPRSRNKKRLETGLKRLYFLRLKIKTEGGFLYISPTFRSYLSSFPEKIVNDFFFA